MDQNYQQIPQNYQQIPQNFQQIPQNFQQIPQNFQQMPQNFQQIPQNNQQIPQNFQQIPQNFQQIPQNNQQMPQDFHQIPQNNQQIPQNNQQIPQNNQQIPQNNQQIPQNNQQMPQNNQQIPQNVQQQPINVPKEEPKQPPAEKKQKKILDANDLAIIGLTVESYSDKMVDSKSVTFYNCRVTSRISQKDWLIEKRYSEFKKLHDSLSKIFPRLPSIPGTTIFKVTSPEALKKRQKALQAFLQNCIQRRDILQHKLFKQFLELEKNAPEIVANDIQLIYDYKKLPLGVRNFLVVPHRGIMLVCCSEMNIILRSNALLTNISLGFSKKDDDKAPNGAAFIYQCEPSKEEIYAIHKIWAKPFPIQTGTLFWEDKNEILCVGNDDGKIYVFKAKPNTHYMEMNTVAEMAYHTNRVMGLALDPETLHLYSCSSDQTFYVTDLKNKKAHIVIAQSVAGYTNLELDAKNKRIFLTTENGEFQVFSLLKFPPVCVKRLQTSSQSSIRAFHIDTKNNYIFTGNVGGKICILNLSPPNKEKLITEISSFGVGEMKIRVCRSNPDSLELLTGDESGRVVVWSLKTGKPIYLWQAHDQAITQMQYQAEEHLLWTGGKDLRIKLWKLPDKFISEEVDNFDKEETNLITAKFVTEQLEKQNKDEDGIIYSDDDDLNGWCFRDF